MREAPLDLLVIGGGITGAGVALDAALRGLRVGLVERDDFACGTSSRSSKMVHGGLRYLATGDVRIVREALRERKSIQQRAPHLVRPLPMLLPVYGWKAPFTRLKMGTGLWTYDLLGAWRAGVRHSWLRLDEMTRALPNIDPQGLVGGLGYHDSQADDVRLVLANLRTAARHGAMLANGCEVAHLLEEGGRVRGARVRALDPFDGTTEEFDLEAAWTINATGVWADQAYAGLQHPAGFEVLPSKGIHLTVRRDRVGVESGVAFFSQTGNSNVFIEPWQDDLAIIGTSDTPYDGELADPQATETEIATLLGQINSFLRNDLDRSDVLAAWAGLRPLVVDSREGAMKGTKSKDLSRRHRTVVTEGLVTLVGGKLTTYRAMAQDGVDEVAARLSPQRGVAVPRCSSHKVPLEGSELVGTASVVDQLSEEARVSRTVARHLLRRYGGRSDLIAAWCRERPELADQLHPERPYIAAEVVYAARYEMARNVGDVVHRRTRLGLEASDGGAAAFSDIESLLADELGERRRRLRSA